MRRLIRLRSSKVLELPSIMVKPIDLPAKIKFDNLLFVESALAPNVI
jgi:hypothetical protein